MKDTITLMKAIITIGITIPMVATRNPRLTASVDGTIIQIQANLSILFAALVLAGSNDNSNDEASNPGHPDDPAEPGYGL